MLSLPTRINWLASSHKIYTCSFSVIVVGKTETDSALLHTQTNYVHVDSDVIFKFNSLIGTLKPQGIGALIGTLAVDG